MCGPAAIPMAIAIGSTVASGLAKQKQQEEIQSAMNSAGDNLDSRTADVQNKADAQLADVLKQFDINAQTTNLNQVVDSRQEMMTGNLTQETPVSSMAGEKSDVVKAEFDRKMGDAYDQGRDDTERMATLGAWQNNRFLNDIAVSRSAQEIGKLSNFAQGWVPVYQAEMQKAQGAGGGWGQLSDVFKGVGMAASMYGGMAGAGAGASGMGQQVYTAPIGPTMSGAPLPSSTMSWYDKLLPGVF